MEENTQSVSHPPRGASTAPSPVARVLLPGRGCRAVCALLARMEGAMTRRRRTPDQIAQLERQIYEVCEADHPVSVRHIFYRQTDPRLPEPVEKTEHGYKHVQMRVREMRRAGTLPYGWISDSTRLGYHTPTYADPEEFVRYNAAAYRYDLWGQSSSLVEAWVESRSIAGVIRAECQRLAVSAYPTGGFSSLTLAWEAAQAYEGWDKVLILYCGDWDPAGVLIDVALERELRQHAPEYVDIEFRRLAVNEEQILRMDLPGKPRKVGDKRSSHITTTVEAEAIPAPTLRAMVRSAIEDELPEGAFAYAKLMDEQGQEYLRTFRA